VNKRKWEFPHCNFLGATRPKEGIPMNPILGEVRYSVKEKLCKHLWDAREDNGETMLDEH
jgi:hypothetical protein